MPNIATLLKTEITRLARKEVRAELAALKKASSTQRSEIATLKKQLRALQVLVKRSSKPTKSATPAAKDEATNLRFRPSGMKTHRLKLGLSAKDYGLLIGASGLSVYKWEDGKNKPRDKALVRIAEVRKLGKREAARRLEELQK